MPVFAQSIDDIPLFEDIPVSVLPSNVQPKTNTASSLVGGPTKSVGNKSSQDDLIKTAEKMPISATKGESTVSAGTTSKDNSEKKSEPNIGRKARPLDKIVITPTPLPEVSIDITENASVPVIAPSAPVNNRQTGIYIPTTGNPAGVSAKKVGITNLHNVRQFDIEGFYLGMLPKDVLSQAKRRGYYISKIKKALPLFQTSYYDTLCRQAGIQSPDKIRDCIRQYGYQNKQDYVEEIFLVKKSTKESFHIIFTSPETGNEAYQIDYQSKGDNSLNFMPSNLSKKLVRKEAFFGAVFNTYGYPDDDKEFIWGERKDAYMQVSMTGSSYDATIHLVDMRLSNEDYFAAEDWKKDQQSPYHFGFDE